MPPSFVATIFLRRLSTSVDALVRRAASVSPAVSLPARSPSARRMSFMRSTAAAISPSKPDSFTARSNCTLRSAAECVARGSGRTCSAVV